MIHPGRELGLGEVRSPESGAARFGRMRSRNLEMQRLLQYGGRVARTPYAVVIEGETGTGKELFARGLHAASGRPGPFVPLNCSTVPPQMFEAELFGARRGAYTGLDSDRPGLLRVASTGTLFMDEIADLPASTQAKLLRVLEDGRVRPLGATSAIAVDVRVVAASHLSLATMVERDQFRSDLFFRLAAISIRIPPLRERTEDIPVLIRDAITEACALQGVCRRKLDGECMALLMEYPWPGNIRELHNVINAAVLRSQCESVCVDDLPQSLRAPRSPPRANPAALLADRPFFDALAEFESGYIAALLERSEGNISQAARTSGLSRAAIRNKAKLYGIIASKQALQPRRRRVRKPRPPTSS
jgi:DNA-binding NtrC family response regulator